MTAEPFDRCIGLIDDANAQDPNREVDASDGREHPKELLYSQRMSQCLAAFTDDASETLKLAVRAQHLQRWHIPRDQYSRDRSGYLQWRRQLGRFHAQRCGELMAAAGYDAASIERVKDLLQKKNLNSDPAAQTLEDVACLVFIRHYLTDFAERHARDKLVAIIRKTWRKMSPAAQKFTLGLDLPPPIHNLVDEALQGT